MVYIEQERPSAYDRYGEASHRLPLPQSTSITAPQRETPSGGANEHQINSVRLLTMYSIDYTQRFLAKQT